MDISGSAHNLILFLTSVLAYWSSTGSADAATATETWQSRSELNNAHKSWLPGLYSDRGLFQKPESFQWVSLIMDTSDFEQQCPALPGQACHLAM